MWGNVRANGVVSSEEIRVSMQTKQRGRRKICLDLHLHHAIEDGASPSLPPVQGQVTLYIRNQENR